MKFLNFDDVQKLVDQQVTLKDSESDMSLNAKVTAVEPQVLHGDEWTSFALVFEHNSDITVGQGTLSLSHPDFSDEMLFISANSPTQFESIITYKN